jgi:hypothetical protein
LYSFSNPIYLAKLGADPDLFEAGPLTPTPAAPAPALKEPESSTAEPVIDEEDNDADDNHLSLNVDKSRLSKTLTDAQNVVKSGVFVDMPGFNAQEPLVEETKEMADKERSEYKESTRNAWIEKYMRNQQYRIHEVETNGDCFFAVVVDACADIGKKTTVEKLRALVATEMNYEVFNDYRQLNLSFKDEIEKHERDLKAVETTLKQYKKRVKENADLTTADTKSIIDKSKLLVNEQQKI